MLKKTGIMKKYATIYVTNFFTNNQLKRTWFNKEISIKIYKNIILLIKKTKLKLKKINFFMFYQAYSIIFNKSEFHNLIFSKFKYRNVHLKNILYIDFNIKKSQIFISVKKNTNKNFICWNMSTGVLLKKTNYNKNTRRTKIGLNVLLKFLKKKVKLLLKLKFLFAFSFRGIKNLFLDIIYWLFALVPHSRILFTTWSPSVSFSYFKKKKYAAIKKNLKKRLLRMK